MNENHRQVKVDNSNGDPNWSRLAKTIRITRSNLLPRQHAITFLISDGACAQPPEAWIDNQQSEDVKSHYWVRVQDHSDVERKWLKTLGQGIASHFSIVRGRDKFTLAEFPKGYQLFYHVKNSIQTPYLLGYPTKSKLILKFRTAAEFLPHLIWLGSRGQRIKCSCKHCRSGAFGREELEVQVPPIASQSHEKNSRKRRKLDDHRKIDSTSHEFYQPKFLSNYRPLELVWCELDTQDTKNRLDSKYWPGKCQDTQITFEACEIFDLSTKENQPDPQATRHTDRIAGSSSWKSKEELVEKHCWSVQLLGLADVVIRTESQILPWLYRPIEEAALSVVSTGKLPIPDYLIDSSKPMPTLASLTNPALRRLHLQLAIQIGAEIEGLWALVPDYKGLGTSPEVPTAIQNSSSVNSSKSDQMQRMSLWIGAEKVYIEDFVRLKLLEHPHHISPQVVSIDDRKQVLFLHVHFFWKSPNSKSAMAGGRIFELVACKSSEEFIQTSSLRQSNDTWLRQSADPLPKGTTLALSNELPPAPKGFRFSQVTPGDSIHHLDISCIAGRYYSPKVEHERLGRVRHYFSPKNELSSPTLKMDASNLKGLASLIGIKNGQRNYMRFTKGMATRDEILQEALRKSKMLMSSHFRSSKSPTKTAAIKNRR
ncbi:hypothetical protein MJO28_003266 [Puccinia striiformis f. sp. tritici]|uniref:Cryptic loci regulator 2 N-terminal domain-containing protein n=2 Tax=Puccinia striiformis TaxID=27350 RepID=A0A2S4UUK5_9BASI|nr:hypothetical protein Pst134EB_005906 [Puccinia striiformis f. sp. tritici]KAI7959475.1 hypothetical protein MJO28_003266 [Puccinia striiformis f. sp. tritici]KAI9623169.1 hypothetical protein KEM48_009599 [Puccinia striiformis f. sp. tritici PST-130]POW00940.1 hypothetical protein PSTT_12808 [Puccinia striiformis]